MAERKFQKEKELQEKQNKGQFSSLEAFGFRSTDTLLSQPRFDHLNHLTRNIAHPNVARWINVKNNTVKIKIQNLLHTRQYEFDGDIVLIPLAEGNGQAEVGIICEEFRKEEIMQLEFEVCINQS